MRLAAFFLFALLIAINAFAGSKPPMLSDGNNKQVQVFAPDPNKTVHVLDSYEATLDITSDIAIDLYNPTSATCSVIILPSAARGANPMRVVDPGTSYSRGVNGLAKAVFLTYSGCSGATIERQ